MAEDDNIDSGNEVEDKAIAIGNASAGKAAEEIPDYEIVEEDDDRRIAKERNPAPKSENNKKLSNREKRLLHKQRVKEKFTEKDATIERLRMENDQFHAWKAEVEGRFTNVDKAEVDRAYAGAVNNYNQAEADYAASISEGDGAKGARAMKVLYEAQKNIEKLENIKVQLNNRAAPQPRNQNVVNPTVSAKAKAWADRNKDWYDITGEDENAGITQAISVRLLKEKFDPASDEYWDELDSRLEKRGIIPKDDEEDEEDDEDDNYDEPVRKVVKKRSAPPVGGGSARNDLKGSKTRIVLPTAYINALKENGKWDDLPTRNRMIKRYQDGLKNNDQVR